MPKSLRMNDYAGKELLSKIRGGDFAHPGEEEAIDLVFHDIPKNMGLEILDAGCGRGGTADYIQTKNWGNVVGIDIDEQSIAYAASKYPCLFRLVDVCNAGSAFTSRFDVISMFNVIYAVRDKARAFSELRNCAKPKASFLIFDYVAYNSDAINLSNALSLCPPTETVYKALLANSGWTIEELINLDSRYIDWYRKFIDRIDSVSVKSLYSNEQISPVREKYQNLLSLIEDRHMGGILISASA